MLIALQLGASLAGVLSMGHVAARLLRIVQRRPWYEKAAQSFLLGTGAISLLVFYVSLLDSRLALRTTFFVVFLSLLYVLGNATYQAITHWAGHRADQEQGKRWLPGLTSSWLPPLLLLILSSQIASLALAALQTDLGWDGLAIWGIKAKAFSLEGGVSRSHIDDLSRMWSHLGYPLLVPLSEAWVYLLLGEVDEQWVKVLFVGFAVSLMVLFYCAVQRRHSVPYGLTSTILLAMTPTLIMYSSSGYADVPLSALALGTSVGVYFWIQGHRLDDLRSAAVLSALGMWCKREGVVLWLVNLCAVSVLALTSRDQTWRCRVKAVLTYLLPGAMILPWFLYLSLRDVPDNDFASVTMQAFLTNAHRFPVLCRMLLAELTSTRWGALWILYLLSVLFPSPKRISIGKSYLFIVVGVYIWLITGSFVFSIWPSYILHVETSLSRLVLHVAPIAAFFIAVRFASHQGFRSARQGRGQAGEKWTRINTHRIRATGWRKDVVG